jgi:adenylate cyclase
MIKVTDRRKRDYYGFILLSTTLGVLYVALVDGFRSWFPFINGIVVGATIGLLFIFFEFFLYKKYIKRQLFVNILIIRSAYYLFAIIFTMFFELIFARMIRDHASFNEVLFSEEFQKHLTSSDFRFAILYSFILILIINFTRQMNTKLGQGNFLNFILGRYVTPVKQERIFMFLRYDIPNDMLFHLKSRKYFSLMNDIVYDITEVLINYYGEIYDYVDNIIVVSWQKRNGIKHANCIRAFYESVYTIQEENIKYIEKYGFSPRLSAAIHIGEVIRGELGDVKSTIVFNGDVMNMTSRILEQCSILNKRVLITEKLLYNIELPEIFQSVSCGETELRGKKDSVQLFEVVEREFQYA